MRRYKLLTLEERKSIEKLLREGQTFHKIAQILNRASSSIGADVRRNGGREFYDAELAHAKTAKNMKLKNQRPSLPRVSSKALNLRVNQLEMQIEILIDKIKELSSE